MRSFKRLLFCTVIFATAACAHDFAYRDVQNGVVVSETSGSIGVFDAYATRVGNDRLMENCMAKIGWMPNNEALPLCVNQTRGDVRRRSMMLDGYYSPYGQMVMPYVYPPSGYYVP